MRFIDEAILRVQSGTGGNGCRSFRREKFVPLGGPDGGNGGRGGSVILVAASNRNTLVEFKGRALWQAKDGSHGSGNQRTGACASDVEIPVPKGTRVFDDETGERLIDLVEEGQRWVAAKGGDGGFGNAHFKSNRNRVPTRSTPGWPGELRRFRLELLLMADVGLLGFPNAGKSTFISRVSAARPKVADYPFTTLVPSLGVVDMGVDGSFVVADIPGLIRGASDGVGLGLQFLRHVQRTRILLHLVSLGPDEEDAPLERYEAIRGELSAYDPGLANRPEVVLLTKTDLVPAEQLDELLDVIRAGAPNRNVFAASSVTGSGIADVVHHLWRQIDTEDREINDDA